MKKTIPKGGYWDKGWDIFWVDGHFEAEAVDELNLVKGDNEAVELAKLEGWEFNNPKNFFEVTNVDESVIIEQFKIY